MLSRNISVLQIVLSKKLKKMNVKLEILNGREKNEYKRKKHGHNKIKSYLFLKYINGSGQSAFAITY